MARILVVDDDDAVRSAVCMVLERLEHRVTQACDGNQALEACLHEQPDLVITDLVMPEKEGLETIQDLKKKYPGLPIIAMSGGGRNRPESYLTLASHLGAVCVLAKPFSIQEIADAVKIALG